MYIQPKSPRIFIPVQTVSRDGTITYHEGSTNYLESIQKFDTERNKNWIPYVQYVPPVEQSTKHRGKQSQKMKMAIGA